MAGDKEAGFPTQCSAITMFSFCILCVAAPVAKFWNSPHARATTLHKFQFETMNSASTPTLTSTAGSQEYRNPTGAWQHPRRYKFLVVNFYDNLYWCHCTRLIAGSEARTSRRARFFAFWYSTSLPVAYYGFKWWWWCGAAPCLQGKEIVAQRTAPGALASVQEIKP